MRAAWVLVFFCSCAERIPGLQVHLTARATQAVQLDTATFAIEEAELIPCVQQAWWSPISTAYAHGAEVHESPRLAHAAMTVDLTKTDVQPLFDWAPPPGELCGLRLALRPSTAESNIEGTTVFLEGMIAGAPFRQLSTARREVTLPFDAIGPDFSLDVECTPPPAGTDAASTFEALVSTLTVKVTP